MPLSFPSLANCDCLNKCQKNAPFIIAVFSTHQCKPSPLDFDRPPYDLSQPLPKIWPPLGLYGYCRSLPIGNVVLVFKAVKISYSQTAIVTIRSPCSHEIVQEFWVDPLRLRIWCPTACGLIIAHGARTRRSQFEKYILVSRRL